MTDDTMLQRPSGNLSDPFAGMTLQSQSQAPILQMKRPPPLFSDGSDQNEPPNDKNIMMSQMDFLATPDFITPADQEFQLEYDPGNKETKNHRTPVQLSPNRAKRPRMPDILDEDVEKSLSQMNSMPPAAFTGRQGMAFGAPAPRRPAVGRIRSPPCYRNFFKDADSERESYADWKTTTTYSDMYSRFKADFKQSGVLGDGNYSKAFRVRHRLDGCEYAVKRSLAPVDSDSEQFEQYLKEVQVYANVPPHPNIVKYYSSWLEPTADNRSHLYLQLELCDITLERHLDYSHYEVPLSEAQAIFYQMCLALEHLHAHRVAHLDIKPDNIYLGRVKEDEIDHPANNTSIAVVAQTFKLGDFGQATRLGSKSVEEGDKRYLPLEVMNGDYSRLDKADMFSLGATMYQIVSRGALPSEGQPYVDIRQGKFPLLPTVPLSFYNMIKALMHPNPDERPSAARVLQSSFFQNGSSTKKKAAVIQPVGNGAPVQQSSSSLSQSVTATLFGKTATGPNKTCTTTAAAAPAPSGMKFGGLNLVKTHSK